MTVVPDAAGRRVGGTAEKPLERRGAARPQPAPEGTTKEKGRRKSDAAPAGSKVKAGEDMNAEEPAGKKGKKKLLLIAAVVLVLLVGVYMVKGRSHPVTYKPGQAVPNGKVVSVGTITANTADGHLVQAGIDLQLTVVADTKQEAADGPQLTNAAIDDLANWTYAQLLTGSGRTGLQQQLLASFQKILGTVDGAAQQVSAVYFTSFVLQ